MKRASPLVFLGLGAAIATGALFLMSQAVPQTSTHSGSYGPPKKNVVNIFDTNLTMAGGQDLAIYTVPPDRWLTVTACQLVSGIGTAGIWGENYGGVFTPKGNTFTGAEPSGDAVGWVFRPGAQLVFRNTSTIGASISRYSVIGYLSRE
jgi:hypothetical protein